MRRPCWRALRVAAGLVLAAGCGDGAAPPAAAPPALVRLWREGLGAAQVTPASTPAAEERLLFDLAAEGGSAGWYAVAPAATGETLALLPAEVAPGLTLRPGVNLGVMRVLPCRPGEALSLRLTARALGQAPVAPLTVAAVVELREPIDPGAGLGPEQVARFVDASRSASHTLSGVLGAQAVELRSDFVVDRLATQLAVSLALPKPGEAQGLVIESLQLVARPLAAHLAGGGSFPRLTSLGERGAVRVALDHDWREGLLALPGASYAFTLGADARPRRLDLSLGVAPREGSIAGSLRLRVECDGQTLLDETRSAPARPEHPAWSDTTRALPAGATRLVLSAEGLGPDPPLAVFGHPTLRAHAPDARPNVVLISLDTLRPDRLGCYGGAVGLSPRLDALAAEGLRFAQAYSTTSYTLPSHASMLTGQYPAFHGAVDPRDRLSAQRSPFLARLLAEAGYVTAAFTGGGYVSPAYGFAEGFDRYSDNDPVWALDTLRGRMLIDKPGWEPLAGHVARLRRYAAPSVGSWIERQRDGVPFFLFLHTYIVHNYAPDRQRIERFGLLDELGRERPFDHHERERFNAGEAASQQAVTADYLPYYDATIAMADEFVGGVLDALERSGQARNTLVIVTSDHGEEFGEHGHFGHGESLYEPDVRIPLIVRLPASATRQPAVLDEPVSLIDLAPWILREVGLEPDARMSAPAPFGVTRLSPPGRSTVIIELDTEENHLSAVREGSQKLLRLQRGKARGLSLGEGRLYDLDADPGESHDLGGQSEPALRRAAMLEAFHSQAEQARAGQQDIDSPIDRETQDKLNQQGY
jgi:arylsulfatase A-like enzyme